MRALDASSAPPAAGVAVSMLTRIVFLPRDDQSSTLLAQLEHVGGQSEPFG